MFALIKLLHYLFQGSDVLYKNNINKAVDYIARRLAPELDAYSLAVIGGALAVARHPQLTQTLEMMDKYANTTGKHTHPLIPVPLIQLSPLPHAVLFSAPISYRHNCVIYLLQALPYSGHENYQVTNGETHG